MAFLNTSTPIFVQNQILRADDLNKMVSYFEEQARLNRIFTIGIGILPGGLRAEYVSGVLTIGPGVGISSDGVLFELGIPCEYTHYKPNTISANAFKCNNENKQGSCSDDEDRRDVFELLTNDEDTASIELPHTVSGDWDNHVLVLVYCEETTERKSCFNECEQNGVDRNTQIKTLVVPKDLLDFSVDDPDDPNTDLKVDLLLPPVINRLGYTAVDDLNLCALTTWRDLYDNYLERFTNAIADITAVYQQANTEFYRKIIDEIHFANLSGVLNNLRATYAYSTAEPNVSDIQYCYSYFRDLILAYDEFFKVACGMTVAINTTSGVSETRCSFPGYLALGRVGDLAGDDCRTGFFSSAATEGDNERLNKAKKLYTRLQDLVKTVNPDPNSISDLDLNLVQGNYSEGDNAIIRITGSCTQKFKLSHQAVPNYFFLDRVQNNWNAENTDCAGMVNLLTHYDKSAITENVLRSKFDVFDFYRIEGHLGKNLEEATNQIKEENQKPLNLPFDIRPLRIGPNFSLEDIFGDNDDIYFREMQDVYQNTRADLLCKIDEESEGNPTGNSSLISLKQILERISTLRDLTKAEIDAMSSFAMGTSIQSIINSVAFAVVIFERLCEKYATLLQQIENALSFSEFAKIHPGMEHLGGVPSGGTFILVYGFRFKNNDERIVAVNHYYPGTGSQPDLSDEQMITKITEEFAEDDIEVLKSHTHRVVVADFCLPYFCCSDTPVIQNEIKEVEPQIFVDDKFCYEEGMAPVPYTVTPEGGTLTFYVNGVQRGSSQQANGNLTLDIDGLLVDSDFSNGLAEIEIQYQLGNQVIRTSVDICVGPTATITCIRRDKLFDEVCNWVGYNYAFTHDLIESEVDPGTAFWTINGETIFVDFSTGGALNFPIRLSPDGTPIDFNVTLTAMRGGCAGTGSKVIDDFCPDEILMPLRQPCEFTLETIPGGGTILLGIQCQDEVTPIVAGDPNADPPVLARYEFSQNIQIDSIGYVEIAPDCQGGFFQVTQIGGPPIDVKLDPNNFLQKYCLDANTTPIYLFIYNLFAIPDNAWEVLNLKFDEQLTEQIADPITFSIKYGLPGCLASLEILITIINDGINVVDGDGGDDVVITGGGVTPGGGGTVEGGTVTTGGDLTTSSSAPAAASASKSTAKSKSASKPAKKSKAKAPAKTTKAKASSKTTKKAAPKTGKKTAPKTTKAKATKAKPQAKPAKLTPAARKVLNTRNAAQREVFTKLEKDKALARIKAFGLAKSFLIVPPNDLASVNKRFEETATSLGNSWSRAKGKRKTDLTKMTMAVVHNYLDKQVVLSSQSIDANTEKIMTAYLAKLKKAKFKLADLKKSWEGEKLGKELKSKAISLFLDLLS